MPDIEALLEPVSADSPNGENIEYEAVYSELREARRSDLFARTPVLPDYSAVRMVAEEVLKTRSKHLQVAAWLTEAWVALEGLPGLRDGLELQRRLLEDFWETVFPEIDEGDLEFRAAPLLWTAGFPQGAGHVGGLPGVLIRVPLTESGFTVVEYQESRRVGYERHIVYDGSMNRHIEARDKMIAQGRIPPEEFDQAVAASGKAFYEEAINDIAAAHAAVDALREVADQRFGSLAPTFLILRREIEGLTRVFSPLLCRFDVVEGSTQEMHDSEQ